MNAGRQSNQVLRLEITIQALRSNPRYQEKVTGMPFGKAGLTGGKSADISRATQIGHKHRQGNECGLSGAWHEREI